MVRFDYFNSNSNRYSIVNQFINKIKLKIKIRAVELRLCIFGLFKFRLPGLKMSEIVLKMALEKYTDLGHI